MNLIPSRQPSGLGGIITPDLIIEIDLIAHRGHGGESEAGPGTPVPPLHLKRWRGGTGGGRTEPDAVLALLRDPADPGVRRRLPRRDDRLLRLAHRGQSRGGPVAVRREQRRPRGLQGGPGVERPAARPVRQFPLGSGARGLRDLMAGGRRHAGDRRDRRPGAEHVQAGGGGPGVRDRAGGAVGDYRGAEAGHGRRLAARPRSRYIPVLERSY